MIEELKKLLKHSLVYGLGTVLSKAVGFLMIPLYTHYLTPSDYGVLELLDITITIAGIFVGLGISASIFRFYYQYENNKNKNDVVSTALIFVIIFASVTIGFAILNAPIISTLVFKSNKFTQYFIWMFISLLFSIVSSVPETYIMAQQRSALYTIINIVTLIINLSLNIFVVAYLKMGVLGIVYVSALVRAMNMSFLLCFTIPRMGLSFSSSKLREMLKYGLPLLPANAGLFLITFADRFFLVHLATLSAVGIYSLGFKFGFMISILLVSPFNRIWQAKVFELAKKDDAPIVLGKVFTYFSFIVIFGVLGLSILVKDVIKILANPSFWEAYKIVPFIAMACFFRGAYYFFRSGLLIKKQTKYVGYSVCSASFLNVLMNYFLIKEIGIMGAAVSALTTGVIMAIFIYCFSDRLFRIEYEFIRILKLIVVAFGLGWVGYSINIESIAISLLVKFAVAMLFPVMLIFIGFYSTEEKSKVISIMNNIGKRIGSFGFPRNNIR